MILLTTWYRDPESEIEKYLDIASDRALKIKSKTTSYHPHNSTLSFHQTKITRSMLRDKQSAFRVSSIPELHGIFIIREDFPFYTSLWPISGKEIVFDQQLFASFVSSLESFSDEIFESHAEFSGLKFGDIHLVIKQVFDFTFVYFVSNLDHTNFLIADKQISLNSQIVFEQIINSEIYQNQLSSNGTLYKIIEHLITNLHIRLLSLNIE